MSWTDQKAEDVHHWKLEGELTEKEVQELNKLRSLEDDSVVDIREASGLDALHMLLESLGDWQQTGKSCVLLASEVQLEAFGDLELSLAPTWQEALDIIEMERIERALGF